MKQPSFLGTVMVLCCLCTSALFAQGSGFTPPWKQVSSWDASVSVWNELYTANYQYNPDGQITEEFTDNVSGNDLRSTNTYSSTGLLLEGIEEFLNGSTWTNQYRHTYAYDALDSLVEQLDFQWQNNVWDTIGGLRHNYQYTNGRLENDFISSWTPGGWDNSRWFGYQYSTIGEWDTIQVYTWFNFQWQPVSRIVDIAWEDFALAKFQSFTIETEFNGSYSPALKREYVYSGQRDYQIHNFSWVSTWDTSSVLVVEYDASNNLILEEDFAFPSGVREKQLSQVFSHEYDGSATLIRTVEQQSYFGGSYVNFEETIYPGYVVNQFSPQTTPLTATFFPNPSSGQFNLVVESKAAGTLQFEVVDPLGRVVSSGQTQQSRSRMEHPQLLNLSPGMYLYRLQLGKQYTSGKLLVK